MNIHINQLTKKFDGQTVLDHLDLILEKGKITCLTGPSGCGKTTLLHCILGLHKPDSGSIEGIEKTKFAAVFQENRLCSHLDAVSNLRMVCQKGTTTDQIEKELERIGMTDYKDKPVSALSGGMKRRVAILRALLAESDCIMMDEPFKGLDDALKEQLISYVVKKTEGKTVLIITHDISEAKKLNAKILTLSSFQ